MNVWESLIENKDSGYVDFQRRLTPSAKKEMIGVRMPVIRKLARELRGTPEAEEFLSEKHGTYDEDNLHSCLISLEKDFEKSIELVEAFLPEIDNWATCDILSPKSFLKHRDELIPHIKRWIASDMTYTVRFGLEMLMNLYLDEYFKPEYLELAASVNSEEYYVRMMQAWYFATALAKQYDAAYPYIKEKRLSEWVHKKTISKACESYRISDGVKEELKKLR